MGLLRRVGLIWAAILLATTPGLARGQAGVDYVLPASGLTGCPAWTWLQPGCYTDATRTNAHVSPQQLLIKDLAFIQAQHLGAFQRLWVSLDQLMIWDPVDGYRGYDPASLANLDDALHRIATAGIRVDLVLLTNSNVNGFHPEALDGRHDTMRAGYVRAVGDIAGHLALDPMDAQAVAVVDLINEGYYQLERYYADPAHVGTWTFCLNQTGSAVITACIDTQIVYPFLLNLYAAVHGAYPAIVATVSDTGRLLGSGQQANLPLYPVDVYDIHLYADDPGAQSARWATGLSLPKPWFAGEVGCGSGNTACTYDGTAALAVDSWWLANLPADGATAVLVEDRRTAWTYPYVSGQGEVATLSQVGRQIAQANPTASATNPPTATATVTATAVPTVTATATSTATPTATVRSILPWTPVVQLPHGMPHGPYTATLVLADSAGRIISAAVVRGTN